MARFSLLLLAFLSLSIFARGYEANYTVSVKGFAAGTVHEVLNLEQGRYQMQSTITPNFAARLLGFGVIHERVKGHYQQQALFPEHYQRESISTKVIPLTADWQAGTLSIVRGGQKTQLHYGKNPPLDPLSLRVLLWMNAQNPPPSVNVLSENQVMTYTLRAANTHQLNYSDATHFTHITLAGNPAQIAEISQGRSGKVRLRAQLTHYRSIP